MRKSRLIEYAISVSLPILLWSGAFELRLASPLLLPSPVQVLSTLKNLLASGDSLPDFAATFGRWSLGFSLGTLAGAALGLVLGSNQRLYRVCEFPLEFLRSMPVTAVFPLFLMVFGAGDEAKVAMAFLPTFLLMSVNTSYGVLHASPERRRMARIFGASRLQTFFYVVAPEALPQMFVGLRLALSLSLIVTVVSEMFIGTDAGVGQRIYDSYLTNSTPVLFALLLLLGFLGYGLNKILLLIEKRSIYWAGK